jgi:hypothetical protein
MTARPYRGLERGGSGDAAVLERAAGHHRGRGQRAVAQLFVLGARAGAGGGGGLLHRCVAVVAFAGE